MMTLFSETMSPLPENASWVEWEEYLSRLPPRPTPAPEESAIVSGTRSSGRKRPTKKVQRRNKRS